MPLFVFISGRFSQFTDLERFKRGIFRIVETLIIFHFLRCSIQLLQGEGIHLSMFTTPSFVLWYLAALIYWRILVLIVPEKLKNSPKQMIAVSVIISLLAPFIPGTLGKHFVVERSMTFLPFFVLGYYSTGIDIKRLTTKISHTISIVYLLALFICLYMSLQYYNVNTATVVHYSFCYWTGSFLEFVEKFGIRCLYIPLAIVTGFMVMSIVPVWKFVDKLGGVISMFIYVYHMFVVDFLKYGVQHSFFPSNELFLLLYTIASFILMLCLSRFKIMVILLNPISYLASKYKR